MRLGVNQLTKEARKGLLLCFVTVYSKILHKFRAFNCQTSFSPFSHGSTHNSVVRCFRGVLQPDCGMIRTRHTGDIDRCLGLAHSPPRLLSYNEHISVFDCPNLCRPNVEAVSLPRYGEVANRISAPSVSYMRALRPSVQDPEEPVDPQNVLRHLNQSIDSTSSCRRWLNVSLPFFDTQLPVELQLEVIDRLYGLSSAAGYPAERSYCSI